MTHQTVEYTLEKNQEIEKNQENLQTVVDTDHKERKYDGRYLFESFDLPHVA